MKIDIDMRVTLEMPDEDATDMAKGMSPKELSDFLGSSLVKLTGGVMVPILETATPGKYTIELIK